MTDSSSASTPISVTMIADFACPWCRIGKANLDAALAQWTGAPVDVTYLPFFLDPTLPAEGKDFREHLSAKFQGVPLDAMFDRVSQAGAQAADSSFRWDLVGKSPNTTLAHQLIFIAPDETRGALSTAIYDAYFRQGKDITDLDTLVELAGEAGSIASRCASGSPRAKAPPRSAASPARFPSRASPACPSSFSTASSRSTAPNPPGVILEAIRQASRTSPVAG